MNLTQIYADCDRRSYYSRSSDEIWAAINSASRLIYDFVLKELSGYWIKWDAGTVTFANGVEEYALPADLETLIRIRERLDSNSSWALMNPAGLTDTQMLAPLGAADLQFSSGLGSQFSFYGPYLDQAGSQASPQAAQKIRVEPIPTGTRQVELVYVAKYVEVTDKSSFLQIPDEGSGRPALADLAVAELVRQNNDSLAGEYEGSGMKKLTLFLCTVRARQQTPKQQRPYLSDFD